MINNLRSLFLLGGNSVGLGQYCSEITVELWPFLPTVLYHVIGKVKVGQFLLWFC